MVCSHCSVALPSDAAFCPSCGAATSPTSPSPAAPITARQVGAQLQEARRSLPYGSIHIASAAFAVVATVLSTTSWGARPSWLLTILALVGIGAVTAADLRRRGAFRLDAWPLGERQETAVVAATLVLLAATSLVSLHLLLGSVMWLLSLACLGWGAWPVLRPYADLAPSRLLGGYRALAVGGVVVLLAAMTQNFGSGASYLMPGYGYGCGLSGCGYGVNYGYGSFFTLGVTYPGVAVEWAEIIVVALFVGLAALLAAGDWRPSWLRAVPVATAGLTVAWLAWSIAGSVLVKGGSKQLAWWIAIAALAAYTAGSALLALGQDDGAYAPARLVRRLRGEQSAG